MAAFRIHTWDKNIWNAVCRDNKYNIQNKWPYNVIDIGAHIGAFTSFMVRNKKSKHVISVEPDPDNFRYLSGNVKDLVKLSKVTVINSGICKFHRPLKLLRPAKENTGGITYIPSDDGSIPSISLDEIIDMLDESPILLKLDCEGCEHEALRSCTKLHRIHTIVGEFHTWFGQNESTLCKLLTKNNFTFNCHSRDNPPFIGLFTSINQTDPSDAE